MPRAAQLILPFHTVHLSSFAAISTHPATPEVSVPVRTPAPAPAPAPAAESSVSFKQENDLMQSVSTLWLETIYRHLDES